VLYLAMPLVVPDFIPVLGQLDDVLVVLVGMALPFRFADRGAIDEHVGALEACWSRDVDERAWRIARLDGPDAEALADDETPNIWSGDVALARMPPGVEGDEPVAGPMIMFPWRRAPA
jgi:uncharacterized membrane protein YkvA (DUF1232 family)